MRTRVLGPILAGVVLVVVAIAIPALQAISRERTQELVLSRSVSLSRFAGLARGSLDSGDTTALRQHGEQYVGLYGEQVLVIDTAGRTIFASAGVDADAPDIAAAATAARLNQPVDAIPALLPWSARWHVMAVPVVGTGDLTGGAVVMRVDASRAVADVRSRWTVASTAAIAGLTLLTLLGLGLARWVVRPVRELDVAAHDLAEGRSPTSLRRTGPPELQRLAASFDAMASAVTGTIRERGQLVEDFSHRLRNPLAALRLRVDSLSAEEVDPRRADALAHVDADLDRLEAMVDAMLDLADAEHRAGAGSVATLLRPDERPLELTCDFFTSEVVARWAPTAEAGGARLTRTGLEHVVLAASAMDVHDMVDELLDNAVKYAGGDVTLDVRQADQHAVITVSDTGVGLDQTGRDRALERFWRADPRGEVPGSGLGLSIVDQLARASRGSLALRPGDPGGLVAELTLPLAPGPHGGSR